MPVSRSLILYVVVVLGGWAGLTWELIWFHHAALVIGVTAQASAVVLAGVMLGMTGGALLAGALLRSRPKLPVLRLYALLEGGIGISALGVIAVMGPVAELDQRVFAWHPEAATPLSSLLIALAICLPTMAMGATMPVLARLAPLMSTSISRLYALNVAGAGAGVLVTIFWAVPAVGFDLTAALVASLNLLLALVLMSITPDRLGAALPDTPGASSAPTGRDPDLRRATLIAAATGFATFCLEVTWFRSIRAAYQATSESFAIMLATVLLALYAGAALAPRLRRSARISVPGLLVTAGTLIWLVTPLIERIDLVFLQATDMPLGYAGLLLARFLCLAVTMGLPMMVLGVCLPWVLDAHPQPRSVALLYAMNTLGAIAGSLLAAWALLPTLGASQTAWVAAAALLLPAVLVLRGRALASTVACAVLGVATAHAFSSGVGRVRIQGTFLPGQYELLASREGPENTVSVVELPSGVRMLMIDGFAASSNAPHADYMDWMGRLPVIFSPSPKRALVICFGTGQTADAVRHPGLESLDIVDISPGVFAMAPLFPDNRGVLQDPRVQHHVMDGRIWLRRVEGQYDAITLEPMPPTFAGSNSLYSREFYRLAYDDLVDGGTLAQWLPFHLVNVPEAAAIARSFVDVFPDARLWIDYASSTGILLGRKNGEPGAPWPATWWDGEPGPDDLQTVEAGLLPPAVLDAYAQRGLAVTDDNQLLSYGLGRSGFMMFGFHERNWQFIHTVLEVTAARAGIELPDSVPTRPGESR